MTKLQPTDSRVQTIEELLSSYFGTYEICVDNARMSFEAIAVRMNFLDDPIQKAKDLVGIFEKNVFSKAFSSRVLLKSFWVLVHKQSEFLYIREYLKILKLENKIDHNLRVIIEDYEKLLEHLNNFPGPVKFDRRIHTASQIKERLSENQKCFRKDFRIDSRKFKTLNEHKLIEKPSGQAKAFPKSAKKKIVAVRELLTKELAKKNQDSDNFRPWEDMGKNGMGYRAEASKITLEILRCFDIDLKSANNVRNLDYR